MLVGDFLTLGNLDSFPKLYYYLETEKLVVVLINSLCKLPILDIDLGDVLADIFVSKLFSL